MVGQFGEVQVMDWGLAKVLSDAAPEPAPAAAASPRLSVVATGRSADLGSLTQTGSILGTPAYMSPEQAGGEIERVDERADVFGLGAVLCEILTGEPPYRDETVEAVRLRAVRGQVDQAFARLDGCGADPELIALCKRCLDPDRDARPLNAGEVAGAASAHVAAVEERLRRAERDRAAAEARAAEEVNTRRVAEEKASEQRRRRRAQRALAVCIGLLLLGVGAAAWWYDRQAGERRADALRRQIEDQERAREDARRAAAEQERLARNGQAIESLLGQCEDALRNDDTDRAANALDLARQRVADGGGDHLQSRLDRCATDLAMLRDLDRVDDLYWTAEGGRLQARESAAERAEAFRRFGIDPGKTPPDEAVRRVNAALIRDRLLTALDQWVVWSPSPALVEILHKADPDPYRDALRSAVRLRDAGRQRELAARPEALAQPPRFTAAVGLQRVIPAERREQILQDAVRRRPGNFLVLMHLAGLLPGKDKAVAPKRAGWYRAALAVRPNNVAAWTNLGSALSQQGDLDGAAAAYQEAIRLNRNRAPIPQNGLGQVLKSKGDLDGAVAAFRASIEADPKYAGAYHNLGLALRDKGDLEGWVAAFKEAARLDPNTPSRKTNLERAERRAANWGKLLPRIPEVAAGRAEPKDAADALALAAVCRQPFQKRYALAVRLAESVFVADPARADALAAGHRYNAARDAVRAASGKDPELPAPGAEERARLTRLASDWLWADLSLLAAQAKDAGLRPQVQKTLATWKSSPDLAAVRDPASLAAMPPADRKGWEALWAEVDSLLPANVPPPAPPTEEDPTPE
jgi:tetratricopeptide (TPR) repeat protein